MGGAKWVAHAAQQKVATARSRGIHRDAPLFTQLVGTQMRTDTRNPRGCLLWPRLALPPTMYLDVSSVLNKDDDDKEIHGDEKKSRSLFEGYCHLLGTAVQRDTVEVFDVGLMNTSAQHDNAANHDNWNRGRKSIFIVASASGEQEGEVTRGEQGRRARRADC